MLLPCRFRIRLGSARSEGLSGATGCRWHAAGGIRVGLRDQPVCPARLYPVHGLAAGVAADAETPVGRVGWRPLLVDRGVASRPLPHPLGWGSVVDVGVALMPWPGQTDRRTHAGARMGRQCVGAGNGSGRAVGGQRIDGGGGVGTAEYAACPGRTARCRCSGTGQNRLGAA